MPYRSATNSSHSQVAQRQLAIQKLSSVVPYDQPSVIIDAQGRICRRFIGTRTLPVFEAMISEATKPPFLSDFGERDRLDRIRRRLADGTSSP